MFSEVKKISERLDILVNNAGISGLEGRNDADQIIALRLAQADEMARGGPISTFLDGTLNTTDAGWRRMLAMAGAAGIPVPAHASALAYFDSYRSERLPQNLTQAQRDAFGAHTYVRIDRAGRTHSDW